MLLFVNKFVLYFIIQFLFAAVGNDCAASVIVRVMFRFVVIKDKITKRLV